MSGFNPKQLLAIVGTIVVLAAIIAGAVVWGKHQPSMAKTDAWVVTSTSPQVQSSLTTANADNIAGHYDQAIEELNTNLAGASPSDKQQLYMALGASYIGKQDYDQAVNAFQQADKLHSTFGTVEAIGNAANHQGNKQLAIAMYKQCLGLIKSGQGDSHDTDLLKTKIVNLGGKP